MAAFRSDRIEIVRTPVRAPKANGVADNVMSDLL